MNQRAEDLIADIASRQHGVVARDQLFGAGLSRRMVDYRVRAKRLRPVQRGVYAVGRFVSRDGKRMAAVLACGPGAVLSHVSGAALRQMLSDPGDSLPLDVTVPRRDRGRRPGLRVHRVDALSEDEVTWHRSIPVTSVVSRK